MAVYICLYPVTETPTMQTLTHLIGVKSVHSGGSFSTFPPSSFISSSSSSSSSSVPESPLFG